MPTRVTAIEQSQANGRAEQRVRALRERFQIMVGDARRRSVEIILDHPVAQWAARHVEWIQNFFVKSETIKITPHAAHTRAKAPSIVVAVLGRILVRSKINDDKQPRFMVGWALGPKDTDIITFVEDGSVRYNGSWKHSPEGLSDANVHELQRALKKKK